MIEPENESLEKSCAEEDGVLPNTTAQSNTYSEKELSKLCANQKEDKTFLNFKERLKCEPEQVKIPCRYIAFFAILIIWSIKLETRFLIENHSCFNSFFRFCSTLEKIKPYNSLTISILKNWNYFLKTSNVYIYPLDLQENALCIEPAITPTCFRKCQDNTFSLKIFFWFLVLERL